MGIKCFGSSSSYDNDSSEVKDRNPDPSHYIISNTIQIGRFLIVEINYPNCDNYEGNKILVFENKTHDDLLLQKTIDPHFSAREPGKSPVARFVPSQDGLDMAISFCKNYL